MNDNQIKGNWHQMKGKVKKVWSELTDDDLEKAKGSMEVLYGIIQEKFGDSKEVIKNKLDKLLK